jgi:hypothetical protein
MQLLDLLKVWSLILEDFPPLGIPNVHGLIPDSKPYLVVKIIDI